MSNMSKMKKKNKKTLQNDTIKRPTLHQHGLAANSTTRKTIQVGIGQKSNQRKTTQPN